MRLTSRLSHLGLVFVLLAACASSRTLGPASPEDVVRSFVSALNRADVNALVGLFDPDATAFLPVASTAAEVVGREAIRAAFTPFLDELRQNGEGPEYMHIVPQSMRTLRAGDAVAIVTFDAGVGPVVSRRSLVIHRTPAGWLILHFHGSNVRRAATGAGIPPIVPLTSLRYARSPPTPTVRRPPHIA